jgi:hypothetical protein
MTTIALYNLKGGVGKTASCVNLAYLAARDGMRTLLWDIDPQGSASFYFQGGSRPKGGIRKLMGRESPLAEAATEIAARTPGSGFTVATTWDPHAFLEYCSAARSKPGSLQERVALEVQRAEWQLLFDYCARK